MSKPSVNADVSYKFHLQADSDFRVTTSRRPSDIDMGQDFNAYVRASFADFQLESASWRSMRHVI
jgi:hypothetical protein